MRKKIKSINMFLSLFLKRKINHIINYIYAFTIIELIVVITVLSILSIIVFSTYTNYIKESRDASRFYNLNSIDSSLQVFEIEAGNFPKPINGVNITYSGATLWTQGTFDDYMLRVIKKLSKKPIDVFSLNDYSYSLSYDGREYELGAVIEGESNLYTDIIGTSYAKGGNTKARSMVVGNYNGKAIKTSSGGIFYIIALPTIVTYELNETDIMDIINNEKLSYKGYWNIPAAYTGSTFQLDGGFSFKPNILAIYEGDLSAIRNNENEWIQVLKNFQEAYSGSILANEDDFKPYLNVQVNTDAPSKEAREIAYDLINDQLNVNSPIQLVSGTNFLTYISTALLDNDTRAITQDHLENLWFATKNGVSMFDNNTWGSYLEKDGLVDKDVRDLVEDSSGNMWFATNKGVSKFNGTTWTNYDKSNGLLDNDVVGILVDPTGKLWFATKKGVATYNGTTWGKYEMSDGLIDKVLTGVARDTAGNLWFTSSKGVSKFNGTTWTNYTQVQGLIDKNVISVYADTSGNVWFGTYNGVSKFNGTSFTNYNVSNGLIDNFVQTIYQDKDGDMWFGTLKGASKFDGTTWKSVTQTDGLADNDVQVIFQDNANNMWFGTKKGVTIFFEDL